MKFFLTIAFIFNFAICFAGHIAGGELFYTYIGPGLAANSSKYQITLRLFRECNPPLVQGANVAQLPNTVAIAVFNNTSPATQFGGLINVSLTGGISILQLQAQNPCITNAVPVCYQVANYQSTIELPNTTAGYTAMYQTCCRTNSIINVQKFDIGGGQQGEGATYTCDIPGTQALNNANNSSAVFALKDTTLICKNTPFTLNFSASDADNDSLSYNFCSAFDRGGTLSAADINYSTPPLNSVTYNSGFSGTDPLGTGATINPVTGIISGIAPDPGYYVVNVCITEWRNGKAISFHRKDFTLRVTDCTLTGAALKPTYVTCTGTSISFENESSNSNITGYLWDFGVPSFTTDTSTSPTPTFDYLKSGKDSGTFVVKLKVISGSGCEDSASSVVKVYPGFKAGFSITGTCYLNNYIFTDTTRIKPGYGNINSWTWNFGDGSTLADTSHSKDTSWRYSSSLSTNVNLIVTNDKGCVDTISKPLNVLDKPILNLPFKDTLICSIDTLALKVNIGSGSVLWTPMIGPNKSRIQLSNTASPLVFPRDTTWYYVSVNDNGCSNTDSVRVNVLQFISVKAGVDTGICRTDTIQLKPVSDALSYQWKTSSGIVIPNIKNPLVAPLVNTRYTVTANLGKCQAKDSFLVNVAAYPLANAGSDITICFGNRVTLNGSIIGNVFTWSPSNSLLNANTLNPIAGPSRTTSYVLTSSDNQGCPKVFVDTILVTVIPPVLANAGPDKFAVPNQPVQLNASGGSTYSWSPTNFLSDPSIANPIMTPDNSIDSITYTVTVSEGSCTATDKVVVRVFKNGPDILVPSAFTPNGDGKNDISRPVLYGISKLNYFSIYNRYGQMVFNTSEVNKGWDGKLSGIEQPAGGYVYQTEGVDFSGAVVFRKGTVVLIR